MELSQLFRKIHSPMTTEPEQLKHQPAGASLKLEESLQRDLDLLRGKVSEMANLSLEAISGAVRALVEGNRPLAYTVILRDQYIDELETEIDQLCLEFLVRHQPVGSHLRFAYTTIQINKEIERIGDYAESIARQALTLANLEIKPDLGLVAELGKVAGQMLSSAVQAFVKADAPLAWRTIDLEEDANHLRNRINADLAALSQAGRIPPEAFAPLMTVARRLERAADQAKNLCEDVLYLCTGEFVKHKGHEGFRILFVDPENSGLSQMAEALGNSLHLPRFAFSSAGLNPQPLDVRTLEFLRSKGIDPSNQSSKSLEQMANWVTCQVLITFSPETAKALPQRSNKTILLTWPITDPLKAQGNDQQRQQAWDSAWELLRSNLTDLVGAIIHDHDSKKPTT
jgi:phosphate transport system protein